MPVHTCLPTFVCAVLYCFCMTSLPVLTALSIWSMRISYTHTPTGPTPFPSLRHTRQGRVALLLHHAHPLRMSPSTLTPNPTCQHRYNSKRVAQAKYRRAQASRTTLQGGCQYRARMHDSKEQNRRMRGASTNGNTHTAETLCRKHPAARMHPMRPARVCPAPCANIALQDAW